MLKWTGALAGATGMGLALSAQAQTNAAGPSNASPAQAGASPSGQSHADIRQRMVGYMLAHEQFAPPTLLELGSHAARSGFQLLATSDHLQPWQDNQAHGGQTWVTLGALGTQVQSAWMGTTVTCPTFRYSPAVVAQGFATAAQFHPGRVFLGVGSGEALNEQAATGEWPKWQERWDRLIEAIGIIRALWTGNPVSHDGQFYQVDARLYNAPATPIPLLTAANGRKSMRLAGQHGDGLITDPKTWKQHKAEWEDGARSAGKDPARMPVLVEHYVVVGDQSVARKAAELWRFGPKAFGPYYNVVDPVRIRQRAEAEIPLEKVMSGWPIGTDPAAHIDAIQELFDSGATIVNVHAGQPDQKRVIDFYAENVLPKLS